MVQGKTTWIRERGLSTELTIAREMAQKLSQDVLRRHQRERLSRERWRQVAYEPARAANAIVLRYLPWGDTLKVWWYRRKSRPSGQCTHHSQGSPCPVFTFLGRAQRSGVVLSMKTYKFQGIFRILVLVVVLLVVSGPSSALPGLQGSEGLFYRSRPGRRHGD
jgi:hypothetical protein